MNPLRVLLVDDHEIFLEELASLLSTSSDIEIIGKAFDGAEAFEFIQK